MEARTLGILRKALLALFGAAILAGIFLPVYTDEVGWRLQERAGIDGVDKMFGEQCGANTLARPPFFMMPVRAYSAFFNTAFADPFFVRVSGVLYALAWCAMLLVLVRRIAGDPRERGLLAMVGFGLMALGTMPLLLVWSRPEQPIVLAATAALLVAWTDWRDPARTNTAGVAWGRSSALLALGVIALSYHVKGIFLLPLFLACLFLASRGRAAHLPRALAGVLLAAATAVAARYWTQRLQCPDDPILWAEYARNNMGTALTGAHGLGDLLAAVGKLIANISLPAYFRLPVPRPNPLSNWLEPGQIGAAAAAAWSVLLVALWSGAVLLAALCALSTVRPALRERRIDPRMAIAAILLVTVLGWSATQAIRNVYEASVALPLTMLAVLFALSGRASGEGPGNVLLGKALKALAAVLGVAGIASLIAVAAIFGPSIARASRQSGYLAAQPVSLPVFGYGAQKPQILAAARLCGIGDPRRARALMVDDLTYFTFMESQLPQHRLGVIGLWKGSLRDPIAYLRGRGSSGAVLGCHLLPPDLRARARQAGKFCCLGPPNW